MTATSGPRFYVIRQARSRVIGSRTMSRDEAGREAAAWRDEIGPAAICPGRSGGAARGQD